jgi:hypothetical protein
MFDGAEFFGFRLGSFEVFLLANVYGYGYYLCAVFFLEVLD